MPVAYSLTLYCRVAARTDTALLLGLIPDCLVLWPCSGHLTPCLSYVMQMHRLTGEHGLRRTSKSSRATCVRFLLRFPVPARSGRFQVSTAFQTWVARRWAASRGCLRLYLRQRIRSPVRVSVRFHRAWTRHQEQHTGQDTRTRHRIRHHNRWRQLRIRITVPRARIVINMRRTR